MATTLLANLINPQVFSDSVSVKYGSKIKFNAIARREFITGDGQVITVPRYAYSGDAAIVGEGVAMTPAALSQTSATVTIQKAGKAFSLSDEALKHGLGDPLGETEEQLSVAIAQKIDSDIVAALGTVPAAMTVADASTTASLNVLVNGLKKFGEDVDDEMYLFVHPDQLADLRKDANFINGREAGSVGMVGEIYGMKVIVSTRVAAKTMFVVKPGAVGLYIKGGIEVEYDRDILSKTQVLSAVQYFGCHLRDDSKAIKITLA
jgi:N4-gp56 family major capsid protein